MATQEERRIKKRNLRRKKYVNREFRKKTKGMSMSNQEKTNILNDLWDEARDEYK